MLASVVFFRFYLPSKSVMLALILGLGSCNTSSYNSHGSRLTFTSHMDISGRGELGGSQPAVITREYQIKQRMSKSYRNVTSVKKAL